MSPEGMQILASILKRDPALSESERAQLCHLLNRTEPTPASSTSPAGPAADSCLLTRAELAAKLNVSLATVLRLEKARELRPIFITADCPRFDRKEVDAFLSKRRAIRNSNAATSGARKAA